MTKLSRVGLYSPIEGMTENLSQTGAFIKTHQWHAFQLHEQVMFTFFVPPDFSGGGRTVGLQGTAVITRLDRERQGVTLQFAQIFKELEQIKGPETPGR